MTEQAIGSVSVGTAGNPNPGNAAADPGSNGNGADWLGGLSEGNRKLVETKGWKGADDTITAYSNLEAMTGRMFAVPGESAKPEDWDKAYSRLGWTGKTDSYELPPPAGLPEHLPYDKGLADSFKGWANDARLNPRQAKVLHDNFVGAQVAAFQAFEKSAQEAAAKATEGLSRDWGPTEGEKYKLNVEMMTRAIKSSGIDGLEQALVSTGFIAHDKQGAVVVGDPVIARFLAKVGKDLYSEADPAKGNASAGRNPFIGDNPNLTEIMVLYKQDPDRARAMVRQAGKADQYPSLFK